MRRNFYGEKDNHTAAKASTASILSVAMVLSASHAGGGFATGNQENTYFVCSGWPVCCRLLCRWLS
nr:hypothetical protein [Ligilactobacillus ruminis]